MRLDQYIARVEGLTRNQARKIIKRSQVRVETEVVIDTGHHIDPREATVFIGERQLTYGEHLTLMIHKPAGVVTATRDRSHRTVLDLIASRDYPRKRDLMCVGRLDKDTTGLLLLTTDGGLLQRLTHPRHGVLKRYLARIEGPLAEDAQARFAAGVELRDGTICRPASLEVRGMSEVLVGLHEGRYHQVKRMLAACGVRVTSLHRQSVGGLALGALPRGETRQLTPEEVSALSPPPKSTDMPQ